MLPDMHQLGPHLEEEGFVQQVERQMREGIVSLIPGEIEFAVDCISKKLQKLAKTTIEARAFLRATTSMM